MVKERRSAKRIKYDMVRVDGKAKSVFKRKPYALAK